MAAAVLHGCGAGLRRNSATRRAGFFIAGARG